MSNLSYMNVPISKIQACNCIGHQHGDPVCPCQMRGVTIENGRYVRKQDLGPVRGSQVYATGRVAGAEFTTAKGASE